jgi:adenylate cyclase
MTRRPRLAHYFFIVTLAVGASAAYGRFDAVADGGSAARGLVRGALTGAVIAALLAGLEIFGLGGRWREPLRRLPFALLVALRSCIYAAVLVGGIALGTMLVPGGPLISSRSILFGMTLSVAFNVATGANMLLGPRVLFNFVSGRYHRPRIEERVLLFIDLESSTAIAERLGELRFFDFLNRFFADVTDAIAGAGGVIHKYVGDEVIAAWDLADGIADASAVRAAFAAQSRLRARRGFYESTYGAPADFRAGLHCGPVVLGELGTIKMEIAYLGDTMNTAARIHELCRESGHRIIASDALLDRIGALPPGIEKRALGPIALRGKERALTLYALAERAS